MEHELNRRFEQLNATEGNPQAEKAGAAEHGESATLPKMQAKADLTDELKAAMGDGLVGEDVKEANRQEDGFPWDQTPMENGDGAVPELSSLPSAKATSPDPAARVPASARQSHPSYAVQDIPTPPIDVPKPLGGEKLRRRAPAPDEVNLVRSTDSSDVGSTTAATEPFTDVGSGDTRRTSINFDPLVSLDGGGRAKLNDPAQQNGSEPSGGQESTASENTGEAVEAEKAAAESSRSPPSTKPAARKTRNKVKGRSMLEELAKHHRTLDGSTPAASVGKDGRSGAKHQHKRSNGPHGRVFGTRNLSRARSETAEDEYDRQTGERFDESATRPRPDSYREHEPRWPFLQSTVDDLAKARSRTSLHETAYDQDASVLDEGSPTRELGDEGSPVVGSVDEKEREKAEEELQSTESPTLMSSPSLSVPHPGTTAADWFSSFSSGGTSAAPTAARNIVESSNDYRRNNEEISSIASSPRRIVQTNARTRSYALDRKPSSRQNSYRSSRRFTNNSATSISPASAFLSRYRSSSPAAPPPDSEGQEVGDYVLGRTIGFGGFSTIRAAYTVEEGDADRQPPRRIERAVKIVRRHVTGKSETANDALQADFEHEVALWRCLSHAHILPLIAVYVSDYATFAFTQLNTGGTLFDAVRGSRKGLEPRLARRYAAQLAGALRYLHEDMRVVHRDLKLENCLLDMTAPDAAEKGGNVLLCDFGLADYLSGTAESDEDEDEAEIDEEAVEDDEDEDDPDEDRARPAVGPGPHSTSLAGSLPYAAPEILQYGSDMPGGSQEEYRRRTSSAGTGPSFRRPSNATSTSSAAGSSSGNNVGINHNSGKPATSNGNNNDAAAADARPLLSTKGDIWAFGVVCFALVAGRLPFYDEFAPRVTMQILSGDWDREVLARREAGLRGRNRNNNAANASAVTSPTPYRSEWAPLASPTSPPPMSPSADAKQQQQKRPDLRVATTERQRTRSGPVAELRGAKALVEACLAMRPQARWSMRRCLAEEWLEPEGEGVEGLRGWGPS